MSKHHGPILPEDEFVEAVCVRLGAAGPTDPLPCVRCGKELLDSSGSPVAAHCAIAESTRCHYSVEGMPLNIAQQCDPSADSLVKCLIPGTRLRPAVVLATDLGHATTFLDSGICFPDARQAGADCVLSMLRRTMEYRGPHFQALD